MRRTSFALLAAAAVAAAFISASADPKQAVGAQSKPNVIVIMTDDQAMKAHGAKIMPKTYKWLGPKSGGTILEQGYAVPPLCCPSRAGFLTGQYPHNHGVWQNNYALLRDKTDTLPVWLNRAGYETALVGKYLNKYEETVLPPKSVGVSKYIPTPPGFDVVYQSLQNKYRDFYVSDNGVRRHIHGDRAKDYLTNILNRQAVNFIKQQAKAPGRPFFLYLAHFAPHPARGKEIKECKGRSAIPLASDWREWKKAKIKFNGENYNESNVNDKPPVERYPKLSKAEVEEQKNRLRCARAAMQPVDRGIDEIHKELQRQGRLDDTIVVFVSDNGFFYGEHRIPAGKNRPYTEAMLVPFMMRVPKRWLGASALGRVDQPVGIFDLAPTILDIAGLSSTPHRTFDGISIADALRGSKLSREYLLFEQRDPCQKYSSVLETDTRMLYSVLYDNRPVNGKCRELGRELYDLNRDPEQIRNLWAKVSTAPAFSQYRAKQHKAQKKRLKRALKRCGKKKRPALRKRCRAKARKRFRKQRKRLQSPGFESNPIARTGKRLEAARARLSDCRGTDCLG